MPIISNSIQNNNSGSASSNISKQPRTYRSGNSTITLREGQTLKGIVSDVHGNEITLSLDDGTSFTGKLPDANQYSIGQRAAFQIVSLSDHTIYMKATTAAYLLDMQDTIEQALEEAGLPKSTRNLDVVRSLLQNMQSISKENILASIQLCSKYPDADVNSVISMNHLGMPLTPESVKQYENYQNHTHQLLNKMDTLTDSICDMLDSIGTQVPRISKEVATQLLSLALQGNPSLEEQQITNELAAKQEALFEQEQTPSEAEELPISDEANPSTLAEETLDANAERSNPLTKVRQLFNAITDAGTAARNAMAQTPLAEDFRTPFIHEQTGFVLSPKERTQFLQELSEFPLSEDIKQRLSDGTLTVREYLNEICKTFPEISDEQAGKLLSSKAFHKLIKGQFLNNWTLTPNHLKEEGAIDELYKNMTQQFKALSHFSEDLLGKDIFKQVSQNATDMTENINFMKTLNETFQYVQLPLKMQNQTAHGDLYVMTRKEALKKDPNNLKVLLHLDMDNLGTLDIHISKENTAVTTKFHVSSQDTLHLMERNIHLLQDAIREQGYAFSSEFLMKEKDVDVVNDFVRTETPVGDIKRYNFDLRA